MLQMMLQMKTNVFKMFPDAYNLWLIAGSGLETE